ncbi:hypothetical protein CALVIDRAFT_552562 [Calocera viscosa TUFC12733]|uniref:3-carboxymuconate cyclase n=1 Tax=Calocera viscosa (strain TUFC12733) TaxID=1330018 RepID=A0A167RGG1_CALVF|nr:hypothetical protein CALVIDRAFT_552562 [Calocera viscosa TUFC12733]
MRSYKSLLATSLLLALSVSAVLIPKDNSPAAAVYFINNEPSGNEVVVIAVDSSGTASFSKAVSAGGIGLHANSTGADSTFSQGSVHVADNFLLAVNPGSNTVALFSIDPTDPTNIQMVGLPAPSLGDFPVSITTHPTLPLACVLNGGAENGVGCHLVHPVFGLLPIEGSFRALGVKQTTPPSGPPGSFAQILFSDDGKHLYVSLKGIAPANGTVFVFAADPQGVLSQNSTQNMGGPVPFSINNIPGRQAIFMTESTGGVETFDFTDSFSGVNAKVTLINGSAATCWSTYSERTGNFYIDDAGKGIVSEISLDNALNPTVVNQYPLGNTTTPLDNAIATIGSKEFLLVLQANSSSVSVLSLNGPGNASIIQQLDLSSASVKLSLNMIGLAAWSA